MYTIYESVEILYNKAKEYTETSIELYKLNAIDTTADVISSLVSRIVLLIVVSLFTLFVNIAISLFIGEQMGSSYLGFLFVSAFYLIIAIIVQVFNYKLIKKPISNLVIGKLLNPRRVDFKKPKQDENESL
tara:strand:+ start:1374 stop:1766 length:393 start_codon:yes stop_codon:yes gene_type:complete